MEANDLFVWIGHTFSVGALVGVLTGLFTPLAAVATTVWFCVQVYESKTIQGFMRSRRERKIAKLRLKLAELVYELQQDTLQQVEKD
jgi:hypothetical protein